LGIATCGLATACGGGNDAVEDDAAPTNTSTAVCSAEDATAAKEDLDLIIERFDDANARAGTTSRIALSPVIGEMQEVRRDLRALELPDCATEAVDASVEFMDKSIEAYLAFLSDEPDSTVTRLFDEAERAQEESVTKLAELFANAKD
jgi:hypothetical protein